MRLLFYLGEVERQAEIFNEEIEDAIGSALREDDSVRVWRHLQAAMFAGIVVSRMVTLGPDPKPDGWPGTKSEGRKAAKMAAEWRVRELRRVLALPDSEDGTLIYKVKTLRDSLEHIDERMDLALYSTNVPSISDWYLSDGHFLGPAEDVDGNETLAGLRAFFPEGGVAIFHKTLFDVFLLDIDMLRLRHNAREAQAEISSTLTGRLPFGGGRLSRVPLTAGKRLNWWKEKKRDIWASMAPPVRPDGYIRLWMQVLDKE
ncbi:hypothetical protein Ait01nite_053160 [Actinoplanes italicus]|nr:hypothetical protein Ait01nite_053160 [Actinoplanes italicus]